MAVQDLVAKKVSRSNQSNDCLFPLRRRRRELHPALLQVEDVSGGLSLPKNDFLVPVVSNLLARSCLRR